MKSINTKSYDYQPSSALRRYVQALLSVEVSGNKTKAEVVTGVRRQRFYYNLKKSRQFREWFKNQCQEVFIINLPYTVYSVQKAALQGDMKAALAILEMVGIYRHKDTEGVPGVNTNVYLQKQIIFQDVAPVKDQDMILGEKTGSD